MLLHRIPGREKWEDIERMRNPAGSRPAGTPLYFAGTAKNQISKPNRIRAPRTENNVCSG